MPNDPPETPPGLPGDLAAALVEAATGPKSVTVDGQTVQAHDLDLRQLIEADRYLAGKKTRGPGVRFTKLVPPGAD